MHRTAARKGLLRPLPPMDLPFLVLVLTLVAFGLVMLCSASSAVALYRRQDAFAYVRPQLLYAAMGLGAMWMASRVDYHIYHKLAWPLLALSLGCNVPSPGSTSQRLQPLYSGMNSTAVSSTNAASAACRRQCAALFFSAFSPSFSIAL